MTVDDSPEYYRMRETKEREAAANAANDGVREIHLAMADKYKALAEEAEKRF